MAVESVSEKFWGKWYPAGELERLELVEKLTGMEGPVTVVLANRYLADLASYLGRLFKEEGGQVAEGLRLSTEENQLWCSLPLQHKGELLEESGIIRDFGVYDFLAVGGLASLLAGLQKLIKSLKTMKAESTEKGGEDNGS